MLMRQICERNNFEILALECDVDHCHLFVNVPPFFSPADVVRIVKANTSNPLRSEFPELSKIPALWTRSYFASTAGEVSSDTIKRYVESQKRR